MTTTRTSPIASRGFPRFCVLPALLVAAGCAAPSPYSAAPSALPTSFLSGPSASAARSPLAPLSGPNVERVWWDVALPTGGDPPIPGDPVAYGCRVSDADGDVVEISIEEMNLATNHVLWRDVKTYVPGSAPQAIVFWSTLRDHPGTKIGVRVMCRAVDAQSHASSRSIDLS